MGIFRRLFINRGRKLDVSYAVVSPNGRVVANFFLDKGKMGYFVKKDEKLVVRKSVLGLALLNSRALDHDFALVRVQKRSADETWETVVGQERLVKNAYNELSFDLTEVNAYKRSLTIRLRVFNDGVAFRYEIPQQTDAKRMIISDELTEFALNANDVAWWIPAYQPDRYEYSYSHNSLRELESEVHTPLTVRTTTGHFASVHEAALYNYGSMTLKWTGTALKSDITPLSDGSRAHVDLPFATPWRTITIAHDEKDLTMSRMIWNLNDPPKKNFDWVKPIKFLGIWWAMHIGEWTWAPGERHGATTEHAKEYIDACERLKLPALLIEGWNVGWEGDWLEGGEHNKFMEDAPGFNLDEVASYARKKGVELIGHHETVGYVTNYENQLEDSYKHMREYGIRYLKTGYVGSKMTINGRREYHHSQIGVRHYQMATELAAKYGIMLNVHEPIKGTGTERTWPNILTREGARGAEYEGGALNPAHTCILPFTRMLSGGMDYTPGIFDVVNFTKRVASTITRQLALFVTLYSGMQMAADRPRYYENEFSNLFKFIHDVPVNWERTVPLLGEIGQSYVVARQGRGTQDWYIGGVTNETGRRVELYFEFLDEGADYIAEIYKDSDDAHYRDHQLGYVIEEKVVRREDRMGIYMAPGGGFAIRLRRA
jgi:alpha-glucosidase